MEAMAPVETPMYLPK